MNTSKKLAITALSAGLTLAATGAAFSADKAPLRAGVRGFSVGAGLTIAGWVLLKDSKRDNNG